MAKRRKKGELTKLGERIDLLLAKWVKKRDKYTCLWCGSHNNLHAAHIIPKREGHIYRWNSNNVITLCLRCHLERLHKDPLAFAEWFHEAFPGRYRALKLIGKRPKKYSADERKRMIEELEDKIRARENARSGDCCTHGSGSEEG